MKNLLFACIILTLNSCSSFFNCEDGIGEAVRWDTIGPAIHTIKNYISADINYRYNAKIQETKLSINAEQNILDLIEVEFDGKQLILDSDPCLNSKTGLVATIESPYLKKGKMEGFGDFKAENLIESEKISFEINGSGSADFCANAEEILCVVYGSGEYKLSGNAEYLEAKLLAQVKLTLNFLKLKAPT